MSRNKANVTLPWYGFKPSRMRELARLLLPLTQATECLRVNFPYARNEPEDSEWNTLVTLNYAISLRIERICAERNFAERQKALWSLTTMEARPGEDKTVIKGLFKNIPPKSYEELPILNVPNYDTGQEPTDDDLPF